MKNSGKTLYKNPLLTILHIGKKLERELQANCTETCEVTHTDAKLLMLIAHHPGSNSSDLVEQLEVSPPAVSRQLKKLQSQGYVTRTVDPNNRRVAILKLTAQGSAIQQKVESYLETRLNDLLVRLPKISRDTEKNLSEIACAIGDCDCLKANN